MNTSFYNEVISYYKNLPNEKTREYEKEIANIAEKCTSQEERDALQQIIDEKGPYAYEAFFSLCTVYRRSKDYELMNRLILENEDFKDRISYNHILVMYHVHSESLYDYDELLKMAYQGVKDMPDNAGYYQTFCNAFATICEQCDEEDRNRIMSTWYDLAYECIEKAIELDPGYPKFYWTKGRIISLKGKYPEAEQLINTAISKENSSRPDYALTIMNYQSFRSLLQMHRIEDKYEKRIAQLETRLNAYEVNDNRVNEQEEKEPSIPPVYEGDKPYIFVSYAHADSDVVYKVIRDLQEVGVRVWYDAGIQGGEEWAEVLGEKIINSHLVLLMITEHSLNSANVRGEISLALEDENGILSIMLEDVNLSPGMKLQLKKNQIIKRKNHNKKSFIDAICKALGEKPRDEK